jgi:hypothetical protein
MFNHLISNINVRTRKIPNASELVR